VSRLSAFRSLWKFVSRVIVALSTLSCLATISITFASIS